MTDKEEKSSEGNQPETPDKRAVLEDFKNTIKDLPKGTKFLFSPIIRYLEKKRESLSDDQRKKINDTLEKTKKEINEGYTDLKGNLKKFWDIIKGKFSQTTEDKEKGKEQKNLEDKKETQQQKSTEKDNNPSE